MSPLSFCLPHTQQTQIPPSVTSYSDFSPPTLWIINHHVGRPLPPLKKIHTRVLTLKGIHTTGKNTNAWHICKIETAGCDALHPPLRAGHRLLSAGGNLAFLRLGWKTLPSSRAFPLSLTSQSRVRLEPFSPALMSPTDKSIWCQQHANARCIWLEMSNMDKDQ